jgi:hypothetical protein
LCKISESEPGSDIHREVGHITAIQKYEPFLRPFQTDGHVECGRFSCPICAKQTYHLSLFYVERDIINDTPTTVRLD